jgi:hypothetical protein
MDPPMPAKKMSSATFWMTVIVIVGALAATVWWAANSYMPRDGCESSGGTYSPESGGCGMP